MTTEIDWDKAPEGAEFYADGCFWRDGDCRWFPTSRTWQGSVIVDAERYEDYQERPQPKTKYEYGVEYPTNGQKPELPDDVLVCIDGQKYESRDSVDGWLWHKVDSFRIVDERYKPAETAQDDLSKPDPVNHPKHYAIAPGVEAIDIIKASLTPEQFEGYLLGNFLKYRLRAGEKDDLQQDIAKSNWYRERLNR